MAPPSSSTRRGSSRRPIRSAPGIRRTSNIFTTWRAATPAHVGSQLPHLPVLTAGPSATVQRGAPVQRRHQQVGRLQGGLPRAPEHVLRRVPVQRRHRHLGRRTLVELRQHGGPAFPTTRSLISRPSNQRAPDPQFYKSTSSAGDSWSSCMGNVADEPLWSYYEGNKDNDCDGTAVFQGDLKDWDVAQATSFVSTVQRSARTRPSPARVAPTRRLCRAVLLHGRRGQPRSVEVGRQPRESAAVDGAFTSPPKADAAAHPLASDAVAAPPRSLIG